MKTIEEVETRCCICGRTMIGNPRFKEHCGDPECREEYDNLIGSMDIEWDE